jgi:uncharacterized coiled-coil protein SlyX
VSDRLDQVEVRIAYLEQANSQLSDEVVRQGREIEALRERIAALTARLEAADSQATAWTPEQEKPPHF